MLPYTEHGTGPTVLLFLHFFGSSQREWHRVVAHLMNHRCITADLPGFGDAADVTGYTVEAMREQVDALIRSFAPAPVILIGHSMGGKVAMAVAAAVPPNLQQVILVAPSPLGAEPMTDDARVTMTLANTSTERARVFIVGGSHQPLAEADIALGIADVQRANPAAWKAWPHSGTRENWTQRVPDLLVRTDLIVGEYDKVVPLDYQIEHTLPLVQRSGGRLRIIRNAAHMLPLEASEELAGIIDLAAIENPA